jgi:hypothetical protein
VQSKEAGCHGHLVKPVNFPELKKLIAGFAKSVPRHSRKD